MTIKDLIRMQLSHSQQYCVGHCNPKVLLGKRLLDALDVVSIVSSQIVSIPLVVAIMSVQQRPVCVGTSQIVGFQSNRWNYC